MAASGYTPISLYYSTTASATPSAGNLVAGELALNIADMKLYAKNSSGTVTLLASNSSTGATVSSVSGTGTVNGLTLTGTVTTSGSLTLGGTLSGTASININGTVGATTPTTGAFTTLSLSSDITQSSTTARTTYSNATTSGNGGIQNNTGGAYVLLYPSTHATKSNHTDISGTNINFVSGGTIATVTSTGLGVNTTVSKNKLIVASSNANDAITLGAVSGAFQVTNSNTAYGLQMGVFSTGNPWLQAMRTDASTAVYDLQLQPSGGNVAIGAQSATASAWGSNYRALAFFGGDFASSVNSSGGVSANFVTANAYFNGTNWIYKNTGFATTYTQSGGFHYIQTAPSGTSGNAITLTTVVQISNAGGVSIGTSADPGAGAIYATGNITAYYSSDIKFKENVRDIPNALATVNAIGGKLFDWTDEYIESKGGADGYFVQKADFGVVAQDVQKVFPIAVRTRDDGSLAVDYEKLGALAFAALVELTKRVEALEAK